MTLQSERVAWPDAARGMAIILVVLHHAVLQTVEAGIAEPHWEWVTEALRTMRMPLFFMAAGLFAGKWVQRASWRDMLQNKVLLFLWVFALWVPIRWAWLRIIPGYDQDEAISRLVSRFILPNGGWFLLALAVFFIIAKATARLDRRIQLGIAAAVSIVFFTDGFETGNVGWNGVLTFYVFFLIGCYWRDWMLLAAEALPALGRVGIVIAWPLAVGAAMWVGVDGWAGVSFVLRIIGLAAGVVLAVWLSPLGWLRHLGQSTLPIYMAHSLIIIGIVWAWEATGLPGVPVATPLTVAALALALSYGLGRVAPRIGLGWLFTTPKWLVRTFRAITRSRTHQPLS